MIPRPAIPAVLAVNRGEIPWPEVDNRCQELPRDFEAALTATRLPERPDYEAANRFLDVGCWSLELFQTCPQYW